MSNPKQKMNLTKFLSNFWLKKLFLLILFGFLIGFTVRNLFSNQQKIEKLKKVENVTLIKNLTDHYVVQLVIHYEKSKFYQNNTMVVLFNTPRTMFKNETILCVSKNSTSTLVSTTQPRNAYHEIPTCKWMTALFNCTTVENPTSFGIRTPNISSVVDLPFQKPVKEKLPVVGCFTPIYFEERWPNLIVSIELYKHFGMDRQVVYVNSGLSLIIKMLKEYEKKNFIKIEEFPMPEFDEEMKKTLGYDPTLELEARNQPLAYNDCLMKYREAADFIVMADADDILIPFSTPNYLPELLNYRKQNPHAAAFMYFRKRAQFTTEKSLSSLWVSNISEIGKSVYNPSVAETAWIHYPGQKNDTTFTVPENISSFLHLADRKFFDIKTSKLTKCDKASPHPKIRFNQTYMPAETSKKLGLVFQQTFPKKTYKKMHSTGIYASIIRKCYDKFGEWSNHTDTPVPCVTPSFCEIPNKIPGFKCSQVERKMIKKVLSPDFIIYIPNSKNYWIHKNDGCK